MSYDFKTANGDLVVTESGDLVITSVKKELVQQWLEAEISLMLGEWFMDTNQGTDWPTLLSERDNKTAIDIRIKELILRIDYVKEILKYESFLQSVNYKKLQVVVSILLTSGDVVETNLGVN